MIFLWLRNSGWNTYIVWSRWWAGSSKKKSREEILPNVKPSKLLDMTLIYTGDIRTLFFTQQFFHSSIYLFFSRLHRRLECGDMNGVYTVHCDFFLPFLEPPHTHTKDKLIPRTRWQHLTSSAFLHRIGFWRLREKKIFGKHSERKRMCAREHFMGLFVVISLEIFFKIHCIKEGELNRLNHLGADDPWNKFNDSSSFRLFFVRLHQPKYIQYVNAYLNRIVLSINDFEAGSPKERLDEIRYMSE